MIREGYGKEPVQDRAPVRVWKDGRSPSYTNLAALRESMVSIDRSIVGILIDLPSNKLEALADLLLARGGCAQEAAIFKEIKEEVWAPTQRAANIERAVLLSSELGTSDEGRLAVEKIYSFIVPACISMQAVAFDDTERIR